MLEITIDKKKYQADPNQSVLDLLRANSIDVPYLCDHENYADFCQKDSSGTGMSVCRLCLVKHRNQSEKKFTISTSCNLYPCPGLEVISQDQELARLRKINLELLFADHAGLCAFCYKNMDCELQSLAFKYDIDEFKFVPAAYEVTADEELELLYEKMSRRVIDIKNSSIARDSLKCIKCRRCEMVCRNIQTVDSYSKSHKAIRSNVSTEYLTPLECTYCGQCSSVCPTAAIVEKSNIADFQNAVNDPNKKVIVQTAPSVRVSLGEEFSMLPGTIVTKKMIQGLRQCGADLIFDTNLSADLTIMEEATELIERINKKNKPLPMFTSCCPAWVLFVEQHYPEFIRHISSCRSPQMMMGSLIKSYYAQKIELDPKDIFSVSIMPCVCKKYEAARGEFQKPNYREVDCSLTTRELGKLMRLKKIRFSELEDSKFDPALGMGTSAGAMFGSSGGVTEAALRTAYYFITGDNPENLAFEQVRGLSGLRNSKVKIADLELRVKVVHGLGHARAILEQLKKGQCDFDFLEVMACPGGCIGGGGQPIPTSPKIRQARAKAIYSQDDTMKLRLSHENPLIKKIYKEFLTQPGSRKAEKYLHTHYYPYHYRHKSKD
ncbi:MAG: 4Fe-4S dicluster domain-containing protein [Candidatus Moranbacteria bacterium]|nr:4Fe-4S dicluster domain-containing protein [Candidatus Moranbacteria bacterium]